MGVDGKADAAEAVSGAALEQRLRPLVGRLEQKLDASLHEQELASVERKLGQLEQRVVTGRGIRHVDDNAVTELQEALAALDLRLKDGLTSVRQRASSLECKLANKVDNDAVGPLLSGASDRMKELVALIRTVPAHTG